MCAWNSHPNCVCTSAGTTSLWLHRSLSVGRLWGARTDWEPSFQSRIQHWNFSSQNYTCRSRLLCMQNSCCMSVEKRIQNSVSIFVTSLAVLQAVDHLQQVTSFCWFSRQFLSSFETKLRLWTWTWLAKSHAGYFPNIIAGEDCIMIFVVIVTNHHDISVLLSVLWDSVDVRWFLLAWHTNEAAFQKRTKSTQDISTVFLEQHASNVGFSCVFQPICTQKNINYNFIPRFAFNSNAFDMLRHRTLINSEIPYFPGNITLQGIYQITRDNDNNELLACSVAIDSSPSFKNHICFDNSKDLGERVDNLSPVFVQYTRTAVSPFYSSRHDTFVSQKQSSHRLLAKIWNILSPSHLVCCRTSFGCVWCLETVVHSRMTTFWRDHQASAHFLTDEFTSRHTLQKRTSVRKAFQK